MSQIYKASVSGLPSVPTSFQTNTGTAVPLANILILDAFDSTENNDNGITTKGGAAAGNPPGSGAANDLDIYLTNRITGSTTTVGAVNGNIWTFTPTVIGTYAFENRVAAYNTTSSLGSGYSVFGSFRFDGVNSNSCGSPDVIDNEEGAMSSCDATMISSGADIILQSTGYLGQTINWIGTSLYTFVGA